MSYENENELNDFFQMERFFYRDYYLINKIGNNEYLVIVILFNETNPMYGYCDIDYDSLSKKTKLKKDNLRRIFIKLKKLNLIYFENRKGSRGLFRVYVDRYKRANKIINNVEKIKKNKEADHNFDVKITASNNKKAFYDCKKMLSDKMGITTPHNNTNN